jgi:hypothetical protein
MVATPALQALKCQELASKVRRQVVIHQAAEDEFDQVDERKQARLLRIMELWCDGQRLTEEQFNGNEGREQKGDVNVLLQAFKTHKVRLYGIDTQIDEKRTFVILEVDSEKKQNKADPKILKRAGSRALEFVSELAKLNSKKTMRGK